MRNYIYLIISLFVFSNVFSQDSFETNLKTTYGIKAGLNALAVKVVNENQDNVQRESGVYVGAFVNIPTSESFSIQPEINYASGKYTFNDNINLLHIPVLLKLDAGNSLSAFIGPEAVLLLSLDDPEKNKFNKFMFGFTFGLAYNFTDSFSIEIRPYYSLTRFLDDGPGIYRKYNTLQVGLAYKL
ncbi:MAG: PorT family protein [Flavobacteriaceae bacterium]|nr:PorT family protein [Bacteroidia bacterium]NNK81842.1 PorT family protein [Flavobacteriaceae bacterium]